MKPEILEQSEARIDNMIESNKDLARKVTEGLFIIGYFKGRVEAERLELLTLKDRIEGNRKGLPLQED